jgi:transposase-like protein
MVRGVSCRDYEDVVDKARAGFGIKKSSVSKSFIKKSAKQLAEFSERRFDNTVFTVLMVDGVAFGGEVMICAIGIDVEGNKHVLGVCQGETENAEVVTSLLTNLRDRGINTSQPTLFCIDGAKALAAGIKRVFGKNAVIQRCQFHKKRNVEKHLAKKHHAELKRRMNAAYHHRNFDVAKKLLKQTVAWLKGINIDAARSLEEGLEETLTVIRLGVTGELRKRLSNTNAIESVFSRVRDITRRVKRWRDGNMRHRWCVAGLMRAEEGFRKMRGYRQLSALQQSLTAFVLDKETETK